MVDERERKSETLPPIDYTIVVYNAGEHGSR